MALECSRGLLVGGSWVFRIASKNRVVEIPGTVRWCRLSQTVKVGTEAHPVYRAGVAFDEELSGSTLELFSPPMSLGRAS